RRQAVCPALLGDGVLRHPSREDALASPALPAPRRRSPARDQAFTAQRAVHHRGRKASTEVDQSSHGVGTAPAALAAARRAHLSQRAGPVATRPRSPVRDLALKILQAVPERPAVTRLAVELPIPYGDRCDARLFYRRCWHIGC